MRAALLFGKKDMRVQEFEKPCAAAGELVIQVKCAALCGTDVRMYLNGHRGVSESTPLILGHEISGVVETAGKAVQGYTPGMRVTVAPNMGCGLCDCCVSGNTHLCNDYTALGIHIPGGFAEYVRIPEAMVRQGNVVEIPAHVPFSEAAIIEPFSCVYSAFERCRIGPGDTVLIIGAGPIGLMHAKLAFMGGAAKVLLNDLSRERLEICRALEPKLIPVAGADLKKEVMDLTGRRGVDVCITACPAPQAQIDALDVTAMNGRVMFFGGLPSDRAIVGLNTNLIHYKQLYVTGTARSSVMQFRKTAKLVADGLVRVSDITTAVWRIDQIVEAITKASQASGLKTSIVFD